MESCPEAPTEDKQLQALIYYLPRPADHTHQPSKADLVETPLPSQSMALVEHSEHPVDIKQSGLWVPRAFVMSPVSMAMSPCLLGSAPGSLGSGRTLAIWVCHSSEHSALVAGV